MSAPQFFPNAANFTLENVSVHNVQGDYIQYNGDSDSFELNSMAYASNAGHKATKQCLPGTRTEVLDGIERWAKDLEAPRVLWLHGPAGTGKTAIANTVALRFENSKQLGSFVGFDNSYLSERRHEKVFSTIARDLADRHPGFRKAVADALREKTWLKSTDIIQQWEYLLVKPAIHLTHLEPILLVIESVDESGDAYSRNHLLSVLAHRSRELPSNLRILVTSRPLDDITEELGASRDVFCMNMSNIPKSTTDYDIYTYISSQLAPIGGTFFDSNRVRTLTNLSEGLFQWAFVACEFIKSTGRISNPKRQYHRLTDTATIGFLTRLDGLYDTVLQAIVNDDSIDIFRSVMGQVLGVLEPLSIEALTALRTHFPPSDFFDADDVGSVLKHMGSLLSGTSNPSVPIRPLHSSFLDYLTDQSRSGQFFIDRSIHGNDTAIATLELMKAELRFNICGLETSYLMNSEVPDLAERVKKCISPALSYSCRYWTRHVHSTVFDVTVMDKVHDLLYHRFLYWIEALSLLGCVHAAAPALSFIIQWADNHAQGTDIQRFSADGQRFLRMFGGIISESTPHLYLSAVPFTPTDSVIYNTYGHLFPHAIRIISGQKRKWPMCRNVLRGHTDRVTSVAFSPDGQCIVSGSHDNIIHVWDTETGNAVGVPLEGHTSRITSVDFSQNGQLIVSSSNDGTNRIWDAKTGIVIKELFHLGAHNVLGCVKFFPDNKHIVMGSGNEQGVQIWDIKTSDRVDMSLEGHFNSCVAVSRNGKRIASGLWDNIIRIWDVETGNAVDASLRRHTDLITCVAFSPDSKYIVSGSYDNTICIWDAETGAAVGLPLKGHTQMVASVAFSPDGKHIVSGSQDTTIRFWDMETGHTVGAPLTGHPVPITSIAISPNGKLVISGSNDNTIRIWDVVEMSNNVELEESLEGHTDWISTIAFSPDGKQIISGSYDNNIRVWDAKTGNPVGPPRTGHTGRVSCATFSPDGKTFISGSEDSTICIWDATKDNGGVPDGKNTPSGSHSLKPNHTIHMPESRLLRHSGKIDDEEDLVNSLEKINPQINSIAFSPNGKHIVVGSELFEILIWDAETGNPVGEPLKGHTDTIDAVVFSPDGKRIISGSSDNTIRVWDSETGNALGMPLNFGDNRSVMSIVCSPNGKHICSISFPNIIRIWNVETGSLRPLEGHTDDLIKSVAFSPNGRYIISGSYNGTICTWDVDTGNVVGVPFEGHTSMVQSVAFSPDGRSIISGSSDRTVRIWDADMDNRVRPQQSELRFSSDPDHAICDIHQLFEDVDVTAAHWKDSIRVQINSGWILGPKGRRLFWVPHTHLTGLYNPCTINVIGTVATKLDLSRFAHGPLWHNCVQG